MQRILSLRQATHALVDGTVSFEMLFDDIEKTAHRLYLLCLDKNR